MPDFTIRGNPGAIRAKAATTRSKGQLFFDTGDALAKVDVEGWTGRAADHFREAHDLEPERWTKAGNGFQRAGAALETYAGAVENAQAVARWAADEYARGEQVTQDARAAYDADVSRARDQVANAAASGQVMTLTIIPFDDPGAAIRDNAVREFESARSELDAAAHTCADQVRVGCQDAPEEPGWFESGLRFVGGVLEGAGEALWDLATLSPFSAVNMVRDLTSLATGDLTPEELMAKYKLSLETAKGMLDALVDDPVAFGKELGKGLLDWDTWADDPARALGHLAPDAIMAALTAGSGTVATRGVGSIDDIADGMRAIDRMDDVAGLGRLDDLSDLSRLDELGGNGRIYSMWDEVDHTTRFAPEQLPTSGNAHSILDDALNDTSIFERHGADPWSRQDLIERINTPTSDLSATDRAILNDLRDQIPTPDASTPMQKVITEQQFDDYVMGRSETNPHYQVDGVGGSVTRIEDTAHLSTPESLHDNLRLDYENTTFHPHDETTRVLRFETRPDAPGAGDPYVVPRNSDMDPGVGTTRYDTWSDPFTGNGFTRAEGDVVPEFQTDGGLRMREGAEIWEVLPDGNQRLVAVLRGDEWIPQGN